MISLIAVNHPERWATGADQATGKQISFIEVLEKQKGLDVGEERKEKMAKARRARSVSVPLDPPPPSSPSNRVDARELVDAKVEERVVASKPNLTLCSFPFLLPLPHPAL